MDAGRFAALDFETADHGRDSACSVGVVLVDGTTVVHQAHFLIRPPRPRILFTYLHGIAWEHVADQPTFGDVWPRVAGLLDGVEFLAAHAAAFDRSVLRQGCRAAGLPEPDFRFRCTVQLARQAWAIKPTKLPDVCRRLGIPLTRHHRADADAEACARVVIAARRQGLPLGPFLNPPRA